jgi:3-deoxy-D-manno-octulosonate 8-phosphate phosphatase (KDO 8-P phosphatase)
MSIKHFITDVDGCLTDGSYYFHSEQEGIGRKFFARDFHGMNTLLEHGIKISIISKSFISVAHLARYNYSVHFEVLNKLEFVELNFIKKGVKWDEIAYIGDDVFDIPLLGRVGMAACPSDAEQEVSEVIERRKDGFVMCRPGGRGCVREFSNLVLPKNLK